MTKLFIYCISLLILLVGNLRSYEIPLKVGETEYYPSPRLKEYIWSIHLVAEKDFDQKAETKAFSAAIKLARENKLNEWKDNDIFGWRKGYKFVLIGIQNNKSDRRGGEVATILPMDKMMDSKIDPEELIKGAPREADWKNWWNPDDTNLFIREHIRYRISKGEVPADADILKKPAAPYIDPPGRPSTYKKINEK